MPEHDTTPATEAKQDVAQPTDAKAEATSTAKASDELSEVAGGSMAPEGQPVLPPADHHTALAIAGGVVIAALRGGPSRAADRYVRFLLWRAIVPQAAPAAWLPRRTRTCPQPLA